MSTFISPGVYTVERDLSAYVSDLSATIVGMVGTSEKGPTNSPTLITSMREFVEIFGAISPKHYMGYAADAFLKKGKQLWVNRVSSSDAKKALVSFPLPVSYTPYSGNWLLDSQTSSSITLALSNSASTKLVTLDASTNIPGFDITDSTGEAFANDKVGSDWSSFYAYDSIKEQIKGDTLTITLGAGKGVSAVISDLPGDGTTPKVTLSRSSFLATNSPADAYAVSSIALGTSTALSTSAPQDLLVLGKYSTTKDIKLVYNPDDAALQTALTNATDYTALEAYISDGSASFAISFPLIPTTAKGATLDVTKKSQSLALLNLILSGLLNAVNLSDAGAATALTSCPHLSSFRTIMRSGALVTTGFYGVGSIDATTGNTLGGYKAVSTYKNAAGEILEVRLDSLCKGAYGLHTYTADNAVIVATSQVIAGEFTTSLSRPTWQMASAGTSFVPTIVKLSTIGDTDKTNIAATLSIDNANILPDGTQSYSLRVYERLQMDGVLVTSTRVADFFLAEQFDGTIETIQSKVAAGSRRIALRIDYSTSDTVNYGNGTVSAGLASADNFCMDFMLRNSDVSDGVLLGSKYVSSYSGYDRAFSAFLSGGHLGSAVSKYDIIGSNGSSPGNIAGAATGLWIFGNPEVIDINVLIAPGWSADPAVAKAMTSLCEGRGDAIALIDCPFGLSVQGVIDYRKKVLNINSSYSAMYYPWILVSDTVNKKDIYLPPTGHVAGQYAYNDQVSDVYYAPAGVNRGMITEALATETILTLGHRDALALSQVNPIHTENNYGIYIKGQMTLQSNTTALDRVNVRRLLLKLRKVISTASKKYEFEPGDSITAYRLKQLAETTLEDHFKKGALQWYNVDVGPNVNTPLVRENNELRMEISLIPTKTAEKIIEIFNILPQGGLKAL